MGKIRIPSQISMTYVPLTSYRRLTVANEDNKVKFEAAIDVAISMLMDRGMHPAEMAAILKHKAEELTTAAS
jgi:hypothetical protein